MLQIFWPRALPSESTVHEAPPSKDCGPVPQTMFPLGFLKNAADAADGTEATTAGTLSAKPDLIALLAHTGRLHVAAVHAALVRSSGSVRAPGRTSLAGARSDLLIARNSTALLLPVPASRGAQCRFRVTRFSATL
jgi:hypothetical protein